MISGSFFIIDRAKRVERSIDIRKSPLFNKFGDLEFIWIVFEHIELNIEIIKDAF